MITSNSSITSIIIAIIIIIIIILITIINGQGRGGSRVPLPALQPQAYYY